MTGHFLLGASREDVIVEGYQPEGVVANFNRNNPDASPLKGGLEAGNSMEEYCFTTTPPKQYSNTKSDSCNNTRFKTTFYITPQDIENALDAYKVVYIMKVE